jgi:hypothetical protein
MGRNTWFALLVSFGIHAPVQADDLKGMKFFETKIRPDPREEKASYKRLTLAEANTTAATTP